MLQQGYLGTIDPTKHVSIIGAGVSGLVLGYYLKKKKIDFTIFEKESVVGGKIQTKQSQFGRIELAANAIYTNDIVIELIEELDLPYEIATPKLKKRIWRKNFPKNTLITSFELIGVILRVFKTPPKITSNLSVYHFFKPLLGSELCEEVLTPALNGIYALDTKELHFESVFKVNKNFKSYFDFLRNMRRKKGLHRARSISFKNGMSDFCNRLKRELKDHIKTSSPVGVISQTNTIIATSAIDAAILMAPINEDASSLLNKITYSKLASVTIITTHEVSFLKHSFGILIPGQTQKSRIKGIVANQEIFANSVSAKNTYSYTFIMEGAQHNENTIMDELKKLGLEAIFMHKLEFNIKNWDNAIPLYNNERFQTVYKLQEIYKQEKKLPMLFGNYLYGISLREIITSADTFAKSLND